MAGKNKAEKQTGPGNASGETSEQNVERLQWIQSLPELEIKIARKHAAAAARPKWTDSARSTAEQIEIDMRLNLRAARETISAVIANCDFAIANGDKSMREFAAAIKRIASQ